MRTCSKCMRELRLSSFYFRKRGPRAGKYYEKCKVCMKIRGRKYYHDNRERQLPLALARKHSSYLEKREFLTNFKNRPCTDCGKEYPFYVMDLDHKDFKDKIDDVARMVAANWSLEKIKQEAEKCEVVCANCHRIRTYVKFHKPR